MIENFPFVLSVSKHSEALSATCLGLQAFLCCEPEIGDCTAEDTE